MKRILSILLTGLMVVGMFGCSKKPEQITDIPATPEEAMPDNGQEAFNAIRKIIVNA